MPPTPPTSDLPPLPEPRLKFFADLRVQVGVPQEVGQTAHGLRRVIPLPGGFLFIGHEPFRPAGVISVLNDQRYEFRHVD